MRIFQILFALTLFSSCGVMHQSGHLRLVKTEKAEIPVIVKNDAKQSGLETNDFDATKDKESSVELTASNETQIPIETTDETLEVQVKVSPNVEDLEPDPTDEASNELVIQQATQAERQARTSVPLFGSALISIFMPYIGIFIFIAGLIFYSKANSSRYITPFGQEKLRVSKILLILDSIILGLWFLFIALLLILLL